MKAKATTLVIAVLFFGSQSSAIAHGYEVDIVNYTGESIYVVFYDYCLYSPDIVDICDGCTLSVDVQFDCGSESNSVEAEAWGNLTGEYYGSAILYEWDTVTFYEYGDPEIVEYSSSSYAETYYVYETYGVEVADSTCFIGTLL